MIEVSLYGGMISAQPQILIWKSTKNNLHESQQIKLINKINTSITIPIKISIKNSNFTTSEKLENTLNKSYEIKHI